MQMLSCAIAVGGDDHSIVRREYDTAVTFPELLILKALHGSESVRDIADAGDVSRDPADERERLRSLYGNAIVMQVFPGEHTALPEFDQRMRRKQQAEAKAAEEPAEAPAEEPPEELREGPAHPRGKRNG
jgi:hypothetical protein